jgi:hypothetical protein
MDKKIAALLGAAAALTTVTAAQAATAPQLPPAASYRDLLEPVPDAVSQLKADDARLAEQPASAEQGEQVAQMGYRHHHHHHHHHHIIPRPLRRMLHPRHHHHHHHHHHY